MNEDGSILDTCTISFVGASADPQLQTVLVKGLVKNQEGKFIDQQQIKARINYKEKQALLLPLTSVSRFGDTAFVFVVNSSVMPKTVSQKSVKVGEIYDGKYEILEGLSGGETYVISGIQKLYEGAKVQIEGAQK